MSDTARKLDGRVGDGLHGASGFRYTPPSREAVAFEDDHGWNAPLRDAVRTSGWVTSVTNVVIASEGDLSPLAVTFFSIKVGLLGLVAVALSFLKQVVLS